MGNTAFYANLHVLRLHHPNLYEKVNAFLVEGNSYLHLSNLSSSEPDAFLASILSYLRGGMDFLYLIGLDRADLLEACAREITSENRGILVIEPDPGRFVLLLSRGDLRLWLASYRVFWAIGEPLEESLHRLWDKTLCYAAKQEQIYAGRDGATDEERRKLQEIGQFVQRETSKRKSAMIQRLKELPLVLAHRREQADPRRIWSFLDIRGKAGFSLIQNVLMRTLFFHLKRLDYETDYLVLRDGHYYPPYYRILKMALFEPDLIFLCNEAPAYESALGADLSRSLPIPKVVWFADDPMHAEHLLKRHKVTMDETYLVADYEWAEPLKENGAMEVLYMPGAATKTRRGKKRGSQVCDVVFVGQVRDQSIFFQNLSPAWLDYCRLVVSEKLRFPRIKIRDVMSRFPMPGLLEEDRLDELRQKILWEANTRFRVQVVLQLAPYDLRIYGNEDWLCFLPPEMAKRCFKGVLRFQRLFEVYRNSRITLNIHSLQSYTCLNVRDFDVPASGGFLLSDWLPRAEDVFVPGFVDHLPLDDDAAQEIFFYRSTLELTRLVQYFLQHGDERLACIERARLKVMEQHTYLHRAQWLAHLFRERMALPSQD